MATEAELQLSKNLNTNQERLCYFLLAAAASGIALAVKDTRGDVLSWSLLPLGIAVLFWGLSFYFGYLNRAYMSAAIHANAAILRIERGAEPDIGRHPGLQGAASSGVRQALDANNFRANRHGKLQWRSLILGAVSYIAWHVTELILRTP